MNYVSDRSLSCPQSAELLPVSLANCSSGDRAPLPPEGTWSPDVRAHFVTWLMLSNRFLLPVVADSSHLVLPASMQTARSLPLAACGPCASHTFLRSFSCSLTTETNVVPEQKRLQKSAGVMKGQIPPPQATAAPRPSLRGSCQKGSQWMGPR